MGYTKFNGNYCKIISCPQKGIVIFKKTMYNKIKNINKNI